MIENELYRITFTNRGGQVVSWILKRKPDGGNFKNTDGKPLDLVHHQAAEPFGYPLSLYTYDASHHRRSATRRSTSLRDRQPRRSREPDLQLLRGQHRGPQDLLLR